MEPIEYFNEYLKAFHSGVKECDLPPGIPSDNLFNINAVYYASVLAKHLANCTELEFFSDLNAAICRCVEYGLIEQLQMLLEAIPRLTKIATCLDGCRELDRTLMLRKMDINCYLIAQKHGFSDPEFEKRIVLAQRLIKRHPHPTENVEYSTPTWEAPEYQGQGSHSSGRYWGYRQTLYYLKYNPKNRYRILSSILVRSLNASLPGHWGDCVYAAYVKYVENGDCRIIDKFADIRTQWLNQRGLLLPHNK
jgi:hypothetical protein